MLAPRGAPTVALVVGGMAPAPPLSGDLRPPGRGRRLRPEGGYLRLGNVILYPPVPRELRFHAAWCQRETATDKWSAPGILRPLTTREPKRHLLDLATPDHAAPRAQPAIPSPDPLPSLRPGGRVVALREVGEMARTRIHHSPDLPSRPTISETCRPARAPLYYALRLTYTSSSNALPPLALCQQSSDCRSQPSTLRGFHRSLFYPKIRGSDSRPGCLRSAADRH